MEREKDNIIIITDEDGTAPENTEASIADDGNSQAVSELPPADGAAAEDKSKERGKQPSKVTPKFVKISCAVSAAVIIASAAAAYFIPKNDGAVQRGLDALRKSDEAYIAASKAYNDAFAENRRLSEDLNAKNKELEELRSVSGGLNKIDESNDELKRTRDELAQEAESKQKEYEALTRVSDGGSGKMVTLSSGYYTVGKDIPAGKYTVTGSGSVAVARSGKSTVNKLLSSEGGELELRDDDRIQIDGSAKFNPM